MKNLISILCLCLFWGSCNFLSSSLIGKWEKDNGLDIIFFNKDKTIIFINNNLYQTYKGTWETYDDLLVFNVDGANLSFSYKFVNENFIRIKGFGNSDTITEWYRK